MSLLRCTLTVSLFYKSLWYKYILILSFSCRLCIQTTSTLDTYHRSCPRLLTKVRWHSENEFPRPVGNFVLIKTVHPSQGQTTKVKPFPLMSLLPKHNMSQYYRYYGSLTTPPCSQVVVWTVYEVPIYISWSQVCPLSNFLDINDFLSAVNKHDLYISSSAGSVYLTGLLHGGGCRAGDTTAEQLQTRPPDLQSHRLGFQRCQTPNRDGRSSLQVSCVTASASNNPAGKLHLWTLASSPNH